MNTRYFLGLLALDTVLTVAVLYAPSWIVMYMILPLISLTLSGIFLAFINSKPLKESWIKPNWFSFYDWGTDIIFLLACLYAGYIVLFWVYLFVLPFKLLVKREPYHGD